MRCWVMRYRLLTSAIVVWSALASVHFAMADDDDDTGAQNGGGAMFRAGIYAGQGIPQDRTIAPFEAFPYVLDDNELFFGDLRFFPALNNWAHPANTTFGGNIGAGYRFYSDSYDRVFGGSIWYDADDTRLLYFQQLGLSLESYGELIDTRANFYLPVGQVTRQSSLSLISGSQQFVGDNLAYSQLYAWCNAMKGFDAEAGVSWPWDWSRNMAFRTYAGGYYFVDNQSNSITGVSTRATANIVGGLDAQVQVTYDNFYQTRAFVGLSWTFGALHFSRLKQDTAYGRIGDHTTRNYTVVAPERSQVQYVPAAINPATGTPYTFAHVVSGAAPGGNGSINNPFSSITAAQGANRNIIFVHANSVFSGSAANVSLQPGNIVMGDGSGVQNFINVSQLGPILLPQAPVSSSLPLLTGSTGDSVTLASNTSLTGFMINNSGGSAVMGNGVQNVTLNNLFINNPTVDGLRLINAAGPVSISNMYVNNPTGSGFNIIGATGPINFLGGTTIIGAGGPAINISSLASTGSVTFGDLTISKRHDMGISINTNSAGSVNFNGTTSIYNENAVAASAVDIRDSSGTFSFNTVNISNPSSMPLLGNNPAVNLQNDTGTEIFQTLNITAYNATALRAFGAGNLTINPANSNGVINLNQGGTINSIGGTAVDIQNTNLNVDLTSVSSSNAPAGAYGLRLVNTTGFFGLIGGSTVGSGGVITGDSTGAVFLQNTGETYLQWMTINNNQFGIHADTVSNLQIANTSITNSAASGLILNNTSTLGISNSVFSGNGAANIVGNFTASGGSYAYNISNVQFTSTSGDNIDLTGSGTMNLVVNNALFNNSLSSSSGINANWNGTLTSQISQASFVETGSSITGVLVQNGVGDLTVLALTNDAYSTTGSGGVGFHMMSQGTSILNATNNLVQLNAPNGIGFESSLVSPTVTMANNTITGASGSSNGIQFDSVTGPGIVTLNGNTITLSGGGNGITFLSVPTVFQLQGTTSNTITGAGTPFFAPAGTTTGSILVNGQAQP